MTEYRQILVTLDHIVSGNLYLMNGPAQLSTILNYFSAQTDYVKGPWGSVRFANSSTFPVPSPGYSKGLNWTLMGPSGDLFPGVIIIDFFVMSNAQGDKLFFTGNRPNEGSLVVEGLKPSGGKFPIFSGPIGQGWPIIDLPVF